MPNKKKPSKSNELGAKLIYAAFETLRDEGKEMPMRELMTHVEKKVELSDWAKDRYEKTGLIRWQSTMQFFSIDCSRAGYLIKKKGIWYLTPEGEDALKLSPIELLESATSAYRKWKSEQPLDKIDDISDSDETVDEDASIAYEEVEQIALASLKSAIDEMNPYEFQDIVAALLRGMSYHTPFVAPKGKDGGVDVIAYRDPLGTSSPRIKAQVKHKGSSTPVQDIRQLIGLLQKQGDVGIFVSSGGFTPDAKTEARSAHVHVELIDLPRFIALWQEFYEELSDEDKSLLPLTPIYFLAKKE